MNGSISVASVYILILYGRMHWWYRTVRREGLLSNDLRISYLTNMDQYPIMAIVLSVAILISNYILWKLKVIDGISGLCLLGISLICALLCVIIRF
jgi:hypothetical protein